MLGYIYAYIIKMNLIIDSTNVLVANLKLLYIGHYGHVGSGFCKFKKQ